MVFLPVFMLTSSKSRSSSSSLSVLLGFCCCVLIILPITIISKFLSIDYVFLGSLSRSRKASARRMDFLSLGWIEVVLVLERKEPIDCASSIKADMSPSCRATYVPGESGMKMTLIPVSMQEVVMRSEQSAGCGLALSGV